MLLLQVHVCISESTVVNLLLCCSSLSTKRSYMQKWCSGLTFYRHFWLVQQLVLISLSISVTWFLLMYRINPAFKIIQCNGCCIPNSLPCLHNTSSNAFCKLYNPTPFPQHQTNSFFMKLHCTLHTTIIIVIHTLHREIQIELELTFDLFFRGVLEWGIWVIS